MDDARVRLDARLMRQLTEVYPTATITTAAAWGIALLFFLYQLFPYLDLPILSPQELVWNGLVYLTPARLLLDAAKRDELRSANDDNNNSSSMLSQTYAAKSEALRKALGVSGSAIMQQMVGGDPAGQIRSMFSSSKETASDAPPGLGNWDNSCYQNSVLQGLASLETVKAYLRRPELEQLDTSSTTSGALQELVAKLNDPLNNGKQLWTPAKLKSMSSWQQQDAQEYFSKIMDELDKEAARAAPEVKDSASLESAVEKERSPENTNDGAAEPDERPNQTQASKNPLEGLLAQRVACTRCGFSEGLSMIPFNCLTVPLGSDFAYNIEECLDEYTKLEEINEVECAKCTLLKSQKHLQSCVQPKPADPASADETKDIALPPELRALCTQRLQAVEHALKNDDFADKTLKETCQITKKAHVSSTKTRQAVIGRAPQSLVVHVNRSVFDEMTGIQRKNYASVQYPMILDLEPWVLDHILDPESTQHSVASPVQSLIGQSKDNPRYPYRLQALVTHYGRHENGHYIAYRRYAARPVPPSDAIEGGVGGEVPDEVEDFGEMKVKDVEEMKGEEKEVGKAEQFEDLAKAEPKPEQLKWWRLSDDDVDQVSEDDALRQGGVFMLFYERIDLQEKVVIDSATAPLDSAAAPVPLTSISPLLEAAAVPLLVDKDGSLETGDEEEEEEEEEEGAVTQALPPPQGFIDPSPPTYDDESEATTDVEDDAQREPSTIALQKPPTPTLMRTARGAETGDTAVLGSGGGFRAMAAT